MRGMQMRCQICRSGLSPTTWLRGSRLGSVQMSVSMFVSRTQTGNCGNNRLNGHGQHEQDGLRMTHMFAEHAKLAPPARQRRAALAKGVALSGMDGHVAGAAGRSVRSALGVQRHGPSYEGGGRRRSDAPTPMRITITYQARSPPLHYVRSSRIFPPSPPSQDSTDMSAPLDCCTARISPKSQHRARRCRVYADVVCARLGRRRSPIA